MAGENPSKYPIDLYYAVYDQLEYGKDPGCGEETETVIEIVEEHFKEQHSQTINAILELHAPEQIFDDVYCSHCLETVNYETDQAPYPCETVKILLKHPSHEPLEAPQHEHGDQK